VRLLRNPFHAQERDAPSNGCLSAHGSHVGSSDGRRRLVRTERRDYDGLRQTMDMFTDFQELKSGVVRTILIRRITLAIFTAVAFLVAWFLHIRFLEPLLYTPLVWFLLTFPFKYAIDRQHTPRRLHAAHTAYFVAEILLITVLVHRLGGSEWIGSFFYVFTVIYANFFLPRMHGAWITGLVVAAYAGLVMLEYAGILPHRSLFESQGMLYTSLSYNVATVLVGPVSVYAILAFTVRTFAGIHARKNRTLAAREHQLSRMSKRLLRAHDEERRRIAHGLHDELIQSLAAIKLLLAPSRHQLGDDAYQRINGIVDTTITQTRTLAYSVRPPLLDDLGLLPSLQRLADVIGEQEGIRVHVRSSIEEGLDIAVESLFFHAAQECLQNAVRHAKATRIEVSMDADGTRATLVVQDDGVGFPAGRVLGLGLRGVQERVDVCGGSLSIDTAPGSGTRITMEVPYGRDSLAPCR
jgi:signal transduction histidine kinase